MAFFDIIYAMGSEHLLESDDAQLTSFSSDLLILSLPSKIDHTDSTDLAFKYCLLVLLLPIQSYSKTD